MRGRSDRGGAHTPNRRAAAAASRSSPSRAAASGSSALGASRAAGQSPSARELQLFRVQLDDATREAEASLLADNGCESGDSPGRSPLSPQRAARDAFSSSPPPSCTQPNDASSWQCARRSRISSGKRWRTRKLTGCVPAPACPDPRRSTWCPPPTRCRPRLFGAAPLLFRRGLPRAARGRLSVRRRGSSSSRPGSRHACAKTMSAGARRSSTGRARTCGWKHWSATCRKSRRRRVQGRWSSCSTRPLNSMLQTWVLISRGLWGARA